MNILRWIGWRTLACVGALLVFEWVLRQYGWGAFVVQERDDYLGWRMLPAQRGWSRDLAIPEDINAVEYREPGLLKSDADTRSPLNWTPLEWKAEHDEPLATTGYRGIDWDPPSQGPDGRPVQDPNLYRVAVVGNSFTYGTSVPFAEIWSEQLQRLLQEDFTRRGDERRVLVMNFAVQGYVFEQMARTYDRVIRPWQPNLLIVPCLPHDVVPMDPSSDDPDYAFRRFVLRTSSYDFLRRYVIDRWIPKPPSPLAAEALKAKELDRTFQSDPYAPNLRWMWELGSKRMQSVRASLEAENGRLALVMLPQLIQLLVRDNRRPGVYWGPWAAAAKHADGSAAIAYVDPTNAFYDAMPELVAEINQGGLGKNERGLDTIRSEYPHAQQSLFLLEDTGHYSSAGHALLARQIYQRLMKDFVR
jgi:lysophospholipase L1-like esterase